MIYVNNLVKTFKKPIREEGVLGMLKTLFSRKYEKIEAVKGIEYHFKLMMVKWLV